MKPLKRNVRRSQQPEPQASSQQNPSTQQVYRTTSKVEPQNANQPQYKSYGTGQYQQANNFYSEYQYVNSINSTSNQPSKSESQHTVRFQHPHSGEEPTSKSNKGSQRKKSSMKRSKKSKASFKLTHLTILIKRRRQQGHQEKRWWYSTQSRPKNPRGYETKTTFKKGLFEDLVLNCEHMPSFFQAHLIV